MLFVCGACRDRFPEILIVCFTKKIFVHFVIILSNILSYNVLFIDYPCCTVFSDYRKTASILEVNTLLLFGVNYGEYTLSRIFPSYHRVCIAIRISVAYRGDKNLVLYWFIRLGMMVALPRSCLQNAFCSYRCV